MFIRKISLILVILYAIGCQSGSTYAQDNKIKGYKNLWKNNDYLYNKMAIDLVNGKANTISVDKMSQLLKKYNIVQFDNQINPSEMRVITNEIAYGMIKDYYLPRFEDKIKVYKKSLELSKVADPVVINHANIARNAYNYNASLIVPVNNATITQDKHIDAMHWPGMQSQVSSAIEKLWIGRIQALSPAAAVKIYENTGLTSALSALKKVYDGSSYAGVEPAFNISNTKLDNAINSVFESWQSRGIINPEKLPSLAGLLKRYIILSSGEDINKLAKDIRKFEDLDSLHKALITKINMVSQNIKQYNPSDYAAVAMLQGVLTDISYESSLISSQDAKLERQ
ncbi:MAG: hypothetical protein PHV77_02345 [Candidatus Omnitrophica bacterium]|jgi:hypothetical protein|nr:hypothetical protein [Candidatus Omnitrophota bacterium]